MTSNYEWKSMDKIEHFLNEFPNVEKLKYLYTLWYFWKNCYIDSGYMPSTQWSTIVKLSPYGQELLEKNLQELKCEDEALLKFCLFILFYYYDLLVSVEETNADEIAALLEEEILTGKVKFPFRFGRILYDKYNDNYTEERADYLLEPDVIMLLDNTPIGVYQLGRTLIGPMGILTSSENRYLPPSLKLPLWHCSDTGCRSIHTVRLLSDKSPIKTIIHQISDILFETFNHKSDWESVLNLICFRKVKKELGLMYNDIAALIGDCITEKEMKILLEEALKTPKSQELRKIISNSPQKASLIKSTPSLIANCLESAEQFQLLLILSDKELISLIENCLDRRMLRIPVGQIREAKHIPNLSSLAATTELSCFGLRSTKNEPSVVLMGMIEQIYINCGRHSDLRWRLKADRDTPTGIALFNFLNKNGPEETVKALILPSEDICKSFKEKLCISVNPIENTEIFINRLLWRIGFEPINKDTLIFRLSERLECFNNILMQATEPLTERMREDIRSAGVNLFVSVEEFIDSLITYNVWVLASDHFMDTQCVYNLAKARQSVSVTLGTSLSSGEEELSWNPDGSNTLGVLQRYLMEAMDWMSSLNELDRDHYSRPEEDMPFYVDDESQFFLFKHRQLWADMHISSLQAYTAGFTSICKLIGQANLSSVRNGLDHMRDEDKFPQIDSMIACASRLRQASALADKQRYFPNPLWLLKFEQNRHGIHEYSLIDSNQTLVTINGPSMFSSARLPDFNRPWLVAPVRIHEYQNTSLIFRYQQTNEYDAYWDGYPRRKFFPSKNNSLIEDMKTDESCNVEELKLDTDK